MAATRVVVAALLVCSALGLGFGWGLSGSAGVGASTDFPLFNAGEKVDGLPLVASLRRVDTAEYVSFVYGDCTPGDDEGCAPPAEVQVWSACRRNLNLYESQFAGTPEPQRLTVRGVPAAFLEGGLRLELQTSRSTVVVFGDSQERVLRVAAALRPLGATASSVPLPAPAPGALEGTLSC